MVRLGLVALAGLALSLAAAPPAPAAGGGDCSPLGPAGGTVIDAGPSDDLAQVVRDAPAGATIRLAGGSYTIGSDYGERLVFQRPDVTLRSASGDPADVVIDGGYDAGALVHVFADRVTVAEVTLTRAQDHLVHVYPDDGGPDVGGLSLYRLRLVDSGEQFVKVNSNSARSHWVDGGTVACSEFRMTATGRQNIERAFGCYTGGIDAHSARGWRVRDNRFEGIYCEDGELAEHAVHFWSASRDTVVENNAILNCARAIGFGLVKSGAERDYPDDPYPGAGYIGHYDGLIRNNVVLADIQQYDTGIELAQARGALVHHNTVAETASATRSFSSIDYRFANTRAEIRNNLVRRISARDGAEAEVSHNVEDFPLAWLADPGSGDFHLRPEAAGAIDRGTVVDDPGTDIDGSPHTFGAPDIGADELTPAGTAAGRIRLRVRGRRAPRANRRLTIVGSVDPYIAGVPVAVRFRSKGRTLRHVDARVRPLPDGRGRFRARFRPPRKIRLTVRARHPGGDGTAPFAARRRVKVRAPKNAG